MDYSVEQLCVAVCVGLPVIWAIWRLWADRGLPPGPRSWPFTYHRLKERTLGETCLELQETYGDVLSIRDQGMLVVVLNSVSAIKEAFVKMDDFVHRPPRLKAMEFNDDVFTSPYNSDEWMENKKMLASCLRSAGFGSSVAVEEKVLEQMTILVEHLQQPGLTDQPVDMSELVPKVAANVLQQILINRSYDYDDPELGRFLGLAYEFFGGLMDSFTLEWGHMPEWLLRILYPKHLQSIRARTDALQQFYVIEIEKHVKSFDENNLRDFVDNYWSKTKGSHGPRRMADNIIANLSDGIYTLSHTVFWMLNYVAYYPEVQQRAYEELQKVTGGNRAVTWADRTELSYIDAMIMEIIRHASPMTEGLPRVMEKDVFFRGYRIPRGTMVRANHLGAYMDKTIYDEPETFRPERYLNPDGSVMRLDAWMAFSIGPRKCTAEQITRMEFFLIMSNLLLRFELTYPAGHAPSLQPQGVILRSPPCSIFKLTPR